MAKRHRINLVTASFHYLVKIVPNDADPENPIEVPFSDSEFSMIIEHISNPVALDENDSEVIRRIKSGHDLPFSNYEEIEGTLHFGDFEGAYYGQRYRNNRVGVIPADSLNLRPFHYLITRLRDGRILIGVTYNGLFGDYDGLRDCLTYVLRNRNYKVSSRTIQSLTEEIRDGIPTEIRLTYRTARDRPERRGLFSKTGVIAIKNSDYGAGFSEEVERIAQSVRGDTSSKRRAIATLVSQGNMIELEDDDIVGCSALIRENGRLTTVYFLGGHNMATKFKLDVMVGQDGVPNRNEVKSEIIRVLRERVMPLLVR